MPEKWTITSFVIAAAVLFTVTAYEVRELQELRADFAAYTSTEATVFKAPRGCFGVLQQTRFIGKPYTFNVLCSSDSPLPQGNQFYITATPAEMPPTPKAEGDGTSSTPPPASPQPTK